MKNNFGGGFGGSNSGFGGSNSGFGGSNSGFGGSNSGFGGSNSGFGGSNSGFGGSNSGFGGSNSGFGDSNSGLSNFNSGPGVLNTINKALDHPIVNNPVNNTVGRALAAYETTKFIVESTGKALDFVQKAEHQRIENDPYWQNMPKDNVTDAVLYSVKVGGESTFDPTPGDPGGCNLI